MSIFDQFTQRNAYVKTYAGAPIQEAMQVTQALNQRAATNLATMDKVQSELTMIPVATQADEAYKQTMSAKINGDLETIMESPEHAGMKVRKVANDFMTDPTLRQIKSTQAKVAKFNEAFEKDPSKYGDIPAWKMQKALRQYEEDGGAAEGASLTIPQLYEQIDDNAWMRENGEDIAASTKGVAWDGKDGFIYENTRESLSAAEVDNILQGAVSRDKSLMRQYKDEHQMMKESGYEGDINSFIKDKVAPYAQMFSFDKNITKMKGDGQSSKKSGTYTYDPNTPTYSGKDIEVSFVKDFEDSKGFLTSMENLKGEDDLESQERYFKMRSAWSNAADAVGASESLDPLAVNYIKNADPAMFEQSTAQLGSSATSASMGGGSVTGGYGGQTRAQDVTMNNITADLRSKHPELNDDQIERYARQIDDAVSGSMFMTDIENVMQSSNAMVLDTEMVDVISLVGADSRAEKALNRSLGGSLATLDNVIVMGEDGAEEMSGKDLRQNYRVATAKTHSLDNKGTGVTTIAIDNADGEPELLTLKLSKDDNSIYREVAAVYTSAANDPNYSAQERTKFASKAMNVMYDEVSASAEAAMQHDGPQPLYFGNLGPIVSSKFGAVALEFDADGDFVATNNGVNLFANSEEFSNLMEQASTPSAAAAVVVQYLRQNL